jgi:NAD(P)-dependent dehydrogenase (short-subunit alcohol dehydrogenase family)
VTGGASGIGLAIVRRLAVGGASVALLDLDAAAADDAAAKLRGEGLRVAGLAADVSDRAAVEKAL